MRVGRSRFSFLTVGGVAGACLLVAMFLVCVNRVAVGYGSVCVGMKASELEKAVGRPPDSLVLGVGEDGKEEILFMAWRSPDGSALRVYLEGQPEPLATCIKTESSTETIIGKLLRWFHFSSARPAIEKLES